MHFENTLQSQVKFQSIAQKPDTHPIITARGSLTRPWAPILLLGLAGWWIGCWDWRRNDLLLTVAWGSKETILVQIIWVMRFKLKYFEKVSIFYFVKDSGIRIHAETFSCTRCICQGSLLFSLHERLAPFIFHLLIIDSFQFWWGSPLKPCPFFLHEPSKVTRLKSVTLPLFP